MFAGKNEKISKQKLANTIESPEGNISNKKQIIIHEQDNVWLLSNVAINDDMNEIKGNPQKLNPDQFFTKTKKDVQKNNSEALYEVHIYADGHLQNKDLFLIPLNRIEKIEVFDKRIGSNISTYVFR